MNQMKYLIYACLLLCCFATAFYIFKTLSSSQVAQQNTSVILDYPDAHAIKTENGLARGKLLFQKNCEMCHAFRIDGPRIAGFTKRGPWTDKENIYEWIKNPAAFMKTNAYTRGLKDEYGAMMQASPKLTNEDIDAIIDYINSVPGY